MARSPSSDAVHGEMVTASMASGGTGSVPRCTRHHLQQFMPTVSSRSRTRRASSAVGVRREAGGDRVAADGVRGVAMLAAHAVTPLTDRSFVPRAVVLNASVLQTPVRGTGRMNRSLLGRRACVARLQGCQGASLPECRITCNCKR
jgi:hypothetical protein